MSQAISFPVVRFSLACLLSILATFMLLFLMQDLIKNTAGLSQQKSSRGFDLKYVMVKPPEVVKPVERTPPPPVVEERPSPPNLQPLENPQANRSTIEIGMGGPVIESGQPTIGIPPASEGDILPIVKVQPVYPINAITRGIEGYVIVEFTVTTIGTTRDIRIIDARPANIFNQASINATVKFKYKPRIINGTAVEVRGVQNKFIFELE